MIEQKYKFLSVLTIAGFDGSGGAGIQGDIKTISALGCFATSVLTALPVQNTLGVSAIHNIPADIVKLQLESIFEDIFPDAIKIGMIHTPELAAVIADAIWQRPASQVVLDPVMISSSGRKLMKDTTIDIMIEKLFPLVDLITPNMDEAEVLSGMPVNSVAEMKIAGSKIMNLGCKALLIKGGHLNGNTLTSLYFSADGDIMPIANERVESTNTHGTGCTLSSAIAAYLAQGKPMLQAIRMASEYVHQAIVQSADVKIGNGKGPLNHFFNPQMLIKKGSN